MGRQEETNAFIESFRSQRDGASSDRRGLFCWTCDFLDKLKNIKILIELFSGFVSIGEKVRRIFS